MNPLFSKRLTRISALALVLAAGGTTCYRAKFEAASQVAAATLGSAAGSAGEQTDRWARQAAVDAAAGRLHERLATVDPDTYSLFQLAFMRASENGDRDAQRRLLAVWQPVDDDAESQEEWLRLRLLDGDLLGVRQRSWELAAAAPEERARYVRVHYDTWTADPAFYPTEPERIIPEETVDALQAFEGSSCVILKMRVDGETVAVFKPHQTITHQSYRGEIASWRLNELIGARVTIPRTTEVIVREDEFRSLAGIGPRDSTKFFSNNSDVIWTRRDDQTRWLYGIRKDWVAGITRYPIEYEDIWHPWLEQRIPVEVVRNASLRAAFAPLATRLRGQHPQLVERIGDSTAWDFAHQMSDLHVLDMLTNNFDRYQPEHFIGLNLHYLAGGRIVSIDNGATFLPREDHDHRGVERRLRRIERFSRKVIDAIRWMDTEALYPILFEPNEDLSDERDRYDYFLERRQILLDHVDTLVARYGEASVYAFP